MNTVAHPLSDGSQPGPIGASPADEAQAAPFHASDCSVHNMPAYPAGPCDCGLEQDPSKLEGDLPRDYVGNDAPANPLAARGSDESAAPFPRVSTSHARVTLAGKDTSLAGRPASFLSDDPWLAAWRESQHGPGYDMNEEVL